MIDFYCSGGGSFWDAVVVLCASTDSFEEKIDEKKYLTRIQ